MATSSISSALSEEYFREHRTPEESAYEALRREVEQRRQHEETQRRVEEMRRNHFMQYNTPAPRSERDAARRHRTAVLRHEPRTTLTTENSQYVDEVLSVALKKFSDRLQAKYNLPDPDTTPFPGEHHTSWQMRHDPSAIFGPESVNASIAEPSIIRLTFKIMRFAIGNGHYVSYWVRVA